MGLSGRQWDFEGAMDERRKPFELHIRLAGELGERLKEAAERGYRSLQKEAELRLARSFKREKKPVVSSTKR